MQQLIRTLKQAFFLCIFLSLLAQCARSSKPNMEAIDGKQLYKRNCITCHGIDGSLKLNGARDITQSKLTLGERVLLIRNGRNTMTAFEGILSPEEINAVAEYTFTLKP